MIHTTITTQVRATALDVKDIMTMSHLVEVLYTTIKRKEANKCDASSSMGIWVEETPPQELRNIVECLNNLGFTDTYGHTFSEVDDQIAE